MEHYLGPLCKLRDWITFDKLNKLSLMGNYNAIHLYDKLYDEYVNSSFAVFSKNLIWYSLSNNPNAIPILEKNMDKIYWDWLSTNPNAIHLLEKNVDKIYWSWLSTNPNAIPILEKNMDKIDWRLLSYNPNAIPILQKNMDKICWRYLSENPSLFEYDWVAIRNRMNLFKEELVAKQSHPKNMSKFVSWGFEEFEDLEF